MSDGLCVATFLALASIRAYHWWHYRNAVSDDDIIHLALARADTLATLTLAGLVAVACAVY